MSVSPLIFLNMRKYCHYYYKSYVTEDVRNGNHCAILNPESLKEKFKFGKDHEVLETADYFAKQLIRKCTY
jgi:hypothetical protein